MGNGIGWVQLVNETDHDWSYQCVLNWNDSVLNSGILEAHQKTTLKNQRMHETWLYLYKFDGRSSTQASPSYYHLKRDYSGIHKPTLYIRQTGNVIHLSCDKGGLSPTFRLQDEKPPKYA